VFSEGRTTVRTRDTDRYWRQFVQSLPPGAERPEGCYDAFHFGVEKEEASEIALLVLQGIKTATGSVQWVYEFEGKAPPRPGDHGIVLDSGDRPVCIIETTEVRLLPFDEVDERFAWDGGEWDRTLASWRENYWAFIVSECARIHREPTEKTPLVCERFRLDYREPLAEESV
jgi:uncharacterized protein YhfF